MHIEYIWSNNITMKIANYCLFIGVIFVIMGLFLFFFYNPNIAITLVILGCLLGMPFYFFKYRNEKKKYGYIIDTVGFTKFIGMISILILLLLLVIGGYKY